MPPARHSRIIFLVIVVCALITVYGAAACSSGGSGGPATTSSATSVSPTDGAAETNVSAPETTTTLPKLLSAWEKQLAETAKIQNRLAAYLQEQGVADDDPRVALIYGLRSRVQALSGRQALESGNLELADAAARDLHPTLNRGRNIAEGSMKQTLEEAQQIIVDLGVPSEDPTIAAELLDQLIARLAPLLDEAQALVPTNQGR